MKFSIHVEFGDIGMATGVAKSVQGGNYVDITIDPLRCPDPVTLLKVLDHELQHAREAIMQRWRIERSARRAQAEPKPGGMRAEWLDPTNLDKLRRMK